MSLPPPAPSAPPTPAISPPTNAPVSPTSLTSRPRLIERPRVTNLGGPQRRKGRRDRKEGGGKRRFPSLRPLRSLHLCGSPRFVSRILRGSVYEAGVAEGEEAVAGAHGLRIRGEDALAAREGADEHQ